MNVTLNKITKKTETYTFINGNLPHSAGIVPLRKLRVRSLRRRKRREIIVCHARENVTSVWREDPSLTFAVDKEALQIRVEAIQ